MTPPNALPPTLPKLLAKSIAMQGWSFYSGEHPVTPQEVASERCLLPAVLWRAERLHEAVFGKPGIGVRFEQDVDAFLGVRAIVGPLDDGPRSPAPLFCIEVLAQVQEHYALQDGASMDALVGEFVAEARSGKLPGVDPTKGSFPLAWATPQEPS